MSHRNNPPKPSKVGFDLEDRVVGDYSNGEHASWDNVKLDSLDLTCPKVSISKSSLIDDRPCNIVNADQSHKVIDFSDQAVEQRMHAAIKAAWKYVDRPFVSSTARHHVQKYAEADEVSGKGIEMLFALQTAWTFVHGSGDDELLKEMSYFLQHGKR